MNNLQNSLTTIGVVMAAQLIITLPIAFALIRAYMVRKLNIIQNQVVTGHKATADKIDALAQQLMQSNGTTAPPH